MVAKTIYQERVFCSKKREKEFHEKVNICKIDMYKYLIVGCKTIYQEHVFQKSEKKRVP